MEVKIQLASKVTLRIRRVSTWKTWSALPDLPFTLSR